MSVAAPRPWPSMSPIPLMPPPIPPPRPPMSNWLPPDWVVSEPGLAGEDSCSAAWEGSSGSYMSEAVGVPGAVAEVLEVAEVLGWAVVVTPGVAEALGSVAGLAAGAAPGLPELVVDVEVVEPSPSAAHRSQSRAVRNDPAFPTPPTPPIPLALSAAGVCVSAAAGGGVTAGVAGAGAPVPAPTPPTEPIPLASAAAGVTASVVAAGVLVFTGSTVAMSLSAPPSPGLVTSPLTPLLPLSLRKSFRLTWVPSARLSMLPPAMSLLTSYIFW